MTILNLFALLALVACWWMSRSRPGFRKGIIPLSVLVLGLVIASLLKPSESPLSKKYRQFESAAGYMLAREFRRNFPGENEGQVVVVQMKGLGPMIEKLNAKQLEGVREALSGSGMSVASTGPDYREKSEQWKEQKATGGWNADDLKEWLEPIANPVAVISFIDLPGRLPESAWPPLYVSQYDMTRDFKRLMQSGHLKALARPHGRFAGTPPEATRDWESLFALRYELITRAEDL